MRIVFLNDLGFRFGAGVAHGRQIRSFLGMGCSVQAWAWDPAEVGDEALGFSNHATGKWCGLHSMSHCHEMHGFSTNDIVEEIVGKLTPFYPDMVVVGNIHGAKWPLEILNGLAHFFPHVFVYMHDTYWMTGRCAYPGSCTQHLSGCNSNCPTSEEYPALAPSLIQPAWQKRRDIYRQHKNLHFVANSHWLGRLFDQALPRDESSKVVHLGADALIFRPMDKNSVRSTLGLTRSDKVLILLGAVNLTDRRKGGETLSRLADKFKNLASFACYGKSAETISGVIPLPYSVEPRVIASYYQACDLFVSAPSEEAFGQTYIEAALCGKPCVGYAVGGVGEAVKNGHTGILVEAGDEAALEAAVKCLIDDAVLREKMGQDAREWAMQEFSLKSQAMRWKDLLENYLPGSSSLDWIDYMH